MTSYVENAIKIKRIVSCPSDQILLDIPEFDSMTSG